MILYFSPINENTYLITRLETVAFTLLGQLNSVDGSEMNPDFIAAYEAAIENDQSGFTFDGGSISHNDWSETDECFH